MLKLPSDKSSSFVFIQKKQNHRHHTKINTFFLCATYKIYMCTHLSKCIGELKERDMEGGQWESIYSRSER